MQHFYRITEKVTEGSSCDDYAEILEKNRAPFVITKVSN